MLVKLAGMTVAVRSDSAAVHDMLGAFYPLAEQSAVPMWTFTALVGPLPPDAACNSYGVGYRADAAARTVTLWSAQERGLAITTRKCVREVFLDRCAQAGCTVLRGGDLPR